jgi:glucose-6-phosphate 1-dehydrogenase
VASEAVSFIIVGASGDLAKKKIYPALFSLFCQGLLPEDFNIFGFARSKFTHDEFREKISSALPCHYTPDAKECADNQKDFIARCHYVSGSYDSSDSFLDLYQVMQDTEPSRDVNRVFYLAIPPSIFMDVADAIGDAGFVACDGVDPWSRVVIEKPFGRDRESSDTLTRELAQVFAEDQTFRMDHYLGKELIQNLLVLRFANLIFEPLWNKEFIASVEVVWKENSGVDGRGGYFDKYGIIRDVVQNHLIQVLSLVAMCPPDQYSSSSIAEEKVKLMRSIATVQADDITLGQYKEGKRGSKDVGAYTSDDTVPDDSITPTFAKVKLSINNDRWAGVPFSITAGKGLDKHVTKIRIKFRHVASNIFCDAGVCPEANELVIRIQPDEAIHLRVTNKTPGMGMNFTAKDLDLRYKHAFDEVIPDAYENLILDVIRGDRSLFITKEELEAAWDIFTPILHEIDEQKIVPLPYAFGSTGPKAE